MELLRQALLHVLFVLDQVTYGLIPSAYELIIYLSNINLFGSNTVIPSVINRVYLLLGIFMLFKIAFSMLQYLIDPGMFSDKSKGFGKLITNTLVSMVLLVMTPFLFEKAYEFQSIIITSNVIPRIILGDKDMYKDKTNSGDVEKIRSDIHSSGVDVQFAMFSAFYNLNTADNDNGYTNCAPTQEYPLSNVLGSSDMMNTKDGKCWEEIREPLKKELQEQGGTLKGLFKYEKDGEIKDERNFSTFGYLLWWSKAGGNSPATINYYPIISAIAGGYLLLLLITFAIDIATRVFKLLFLQAIAPIAIISYMDPKESVSSGKFHNWLSECGKTYVSLFIRLAVVYISILLVRVILSQIFGIENKSMYYNNIQPEPSLNVFIYVFLILGIFTFAKKVPQMIESIFGIKASGELSLNPFKTLGENAGVGALVGGFIGSGSTAIASGATAIANGSGALGAAKSAITGGAVGALRGGRGGFGKKLNDAVKAGTQSGGISSRNMLMKREIGMVGIGNGVSFKNAITHPIQSAKTVGKNIGNNAIKMGEMSATSLLDKTGGPTPYQMWNSKVLRYDSVVEQADALKTKASENAKKSGAMSSHGESYKDAFKSFEDRKMAATQLYNARVEAAQSGIAGDAERAKALADYRNDVNAIDVDENALKEEYYANAYSKSLVDSSGNDLHDYDIERGSKELSDRVSNAGMAATDVSTLGAVKSRRKEAYNGSEDIKNNDRYQEFETAHKARENVTKERFYETK